MVTTLTGDNSFGLQTELDSLVAAFVDEYGDLALERLDGEEADYGRLAEALTSLPFLAAKKLVVLRTPGKNKQFAENAEQLLGDVPATTDVIVIEPKLDKRLTYYKFLKSKTDFREYAELDQPALGQWLMNRAKARGGSLTSADARYLIERVGANQQLLANELDKLLLYDPVVTRASIELLTDQTPQSTIFQLLEAAFAGNLERALSLYKEQRSLRVEPPQIIAMLAWQLHVLALLKTAGDLSPDAIARQAKLNPFVVRKSQNIASRLTLKQLKKLVSDLLQIDAASKNSSLNIDEALQLYLLRLTSH